MTTNTVAGVFDNYAQAERAVDRLVSGGFVRDRIEITSNEAVTTNVGAEAGTRPAREHEEGLGERISHFFSRLFGSEHTHDDANYYSEAVRQGSAIVTVDAATPDEADRAADILEECGVVDIKDHSERLKHSGWAGSPPRSGAEGERVIPVVKEELLVGKRRRDRGGVRIYTHTDESSAEQEVKLREEHAKVERRPANRPANEADLGAFKEGTIEVRETVEEPVVDKKARVVEEVVVSKEISEHTETVNGSVRKNDVEVEKLDPGTSSRAYEARDARTFDDYDADYRSHWQSNFSRSGGRYEDYQPAYRYGSELASDKRYRDRDWSAIEPDARRDWESRHPGSAWDRFKMAVQHGWERVSGRR